MATVLLVEETTDLSQITDKLYLTRIRVRERPFNLKGGGGYVFFFKKKYSDSQCCWKKYSVIGGGKQIYLIQSFCHITWCWILEKKIQAFAQQIKMNILTLCCQKKKILNETKNHNPPLQVKWSVPYWNMLEQMYMML
jgi:hypothetical protein